MSYQPLEKYGVIGNMRTAALVGLDGSIDWFCFPHFDSPSVFAAILDEKKGGHFSIRPLNPETRHRQFYWPETNVLMNRFLSLDGVGEIQDFMPAGAEEPWPHQLIRRVRCTRGQLKLRAECFPAFDYARLAPALEMRSESVVFRGGELALGARCLGPAAAGRAGSQRGLYAPRKRDSALRSPPGRCATRRRRVPFL